MKHERARNAAPLQPSAGTLVLPADQLRPGVPLSAVSVFGDEVWSLTPLNHRENHVQLNIRWNLWPAHLVGAAKSVVWAWLNIDTPAELFDRAGSTIRARRTPATTYVRQRALRRFFVWLDDRGVSRVSDVDEDVLRDYGAHIGSLPLSRNTRRNNLFALTLAWAYAPYLADDARLPTPPWDAGEDFTGPVSSSGGENKVDPIHPATMSPLLLWAIRVVDEFSDDIIRARDWNASISSNISSAASPGGRQKIVAYCAELAERGEGLPISWVARYRGGISAVYIAGQLGVSTSQVGAYVYRSMEHPVVLGDAPRHLDPVRGRINGRPWTIGIRFDDVEQISVHLMTACMIVITYLTGMRPEEVLNLRRGSCKTIENGSNGTVRHEIRGFHFKGVRDESGNTAAAGEERADPWIAIAPVARAIAVLEQLSAGDLLWPRRRVASTPGVGGAIPTETANNRIGLFIDWVNELVAEHEVPHEVVPPDPAGSVVMRRFRRTLAWFIYRLPGGRVALGVQYGHLRSQSSQGYGGRSRAGLHIVMAIEEARVLADNLAEAADQLRSGDKVTGPAADRYKRGVLEFSQRFEGRFVSDRQHAALLGNPSLRIYDHPEAALSCVYDPSRALCNPGRLTKAGPDTTPSRERCQRSCANIARTDQHVGTLKWQIANTKADISSGLNPRPIEIRLTQRIATLEETVARHEEESR